LPNRLDSVATEQQGPSSKVADGAMTNFRFVVVAMVFIISIISFLDRSAISYAILALKQDLRIDDAQFGMIAGAFGIGYTVMTLVGGILVDRWKTRVVWPVAAALWSACTILLGLANGFWSLFIFRALLGMAEGPQFPAVARVMTDWLPASERARATVSCIIAVPLASAIGAPIICALTTAFGWRAMFAVLGLMGMIWAVLWATLFRNDPVSCQWVSIAELEHIKRGRNCDNVSSTRAPGPASAQLVFKLISNRTLALTNFAYFSFCYSLFFALNWLPEYFCRTYHLNLSEVGTYLIIPWLGAAAMELGAGVFLDRIYDKVSLRHSRSYFISACLLMSAFSFMPALFTPSLPIALTFVTLGLGFAFMSNVAFWGLHSDIAGDNAATSYGIMNCCGSIASIVAPVLTGFLVKATGTFLSAFAILMVLNLSTALVMFVCHRPDLENRLDH
jgi:ACS family hexuronate transporter-like MFS transporter